MAHHEIPVFLEGGIPVPRIPDPGVIREGDTVSYTSELGNVKIEFELPFSTITDVILSGETRVMPRAGNFFCKCYLFDRVSGDLIAGWSPEKPNAGGEHDVRPQTPPGP